MMMAGMAGVAAEANRALYVHAMVHAYNLLIHVIRELVPIMWSLV